jgi:hypothetical protein
MQDAGIELYLTEVKGPVMDRLADTEFLEQLGPNASSSRLRRLTRSSRPHRPRQDVGSYR